MATELQYSYSIYPRISKKHCGLDQTDNVIYAFVCKLIMLNKQYEDRAILENSHTCTLKTNDSIAWQCVISCKYIIVYVCIQATKL